jgi:adenylate cyclase
MSAGLGHIRPALEGAIPAVMATCSPEGEPNVTFLSQVQYVDEGHVALSYQFFNKTRRNVLSNPRAHLTVMHPHTGQIYRLRLRYLRTEASGALFEQMRAHLEGIASHTGMAGTFRLLGADIYAVEELETLPCKTLAAPASVHPLAALRRVSAAMAQCADTGALVDQVLDALVCELGIEHVLLLIYDEPGARLYAVGSRGYPASGVGAEIALGDGVIGMCAKARTPIRISWATQAYRYTRAIRDQALLDGAGNELLTEIPYPGLADPHSQLGLPLLHAGRLCGVLFVESEQDLHFSYDHEDALAVLAAQLAASLQAMQEPPAADAGDGLAAAAPAAAGAVLRVRCYLPTHSIFIGDSYITKGVAGAILYCLLKEHAATGKLAFSNRELRLYPEIRLPDVVDNLEARLILLRRRLAEQDTGIAIDKCGRGKIQLVLAGPVELHAL